MRYCSVSSQFVSAKNITYNIKLKEPEKIKPNLLQNAHYADLTYKHDP